MIQSADAREATVRTGPAEREAAFFEHYGPAYAPGAAGGRQLCPPLR